MQRGGQLRFRAFIHVHQLGSSAFLDFLAHGAGKTFQCTLGHTHGASLFFRGTADDDHTGTFVQLADHRVEEVPQGFQLVRALDAGGVENQAFELGIVIAIGGVVVCIHAQFAGLLLQVGGVGGVGKNGYLSVRGAFQGAQHAVDASGAVGGTYQNAAFNKGRLARLPALQNNRDRQVDCAKQRLAHGRIGNRLIGIAHGLVLFHRMMNVSVLP